MMRLFVWECRRVLKMTVYWLFVVALAVFLRGQGALPIDEGLSAFERPRPGDEQGVLIPSGDPARIMPEAAVKLLAGWQRGQFTTYPPPLCIYRSVSLSEHQREALGALLCGLYGTADPAALPELDGSAFPALRAGLTWEDFTAAMAETDRLLGGGSDWVATDLTRRFGKVPARYEDLLAEYEACMANDRYTGAFARLFCDYAVLALALFGALPAVALFLQDFGAGDAAGVAVWARPCPSWALVAARCGALTVLQFLPVLVMDAALTVYYGEQFGTEAINPAAFLYYSLLWLLPTLLLVVCAGALLTVGTGTALGAAVLPALAWWSVISGSASGLSDASSYGSLLTPRHNTVGKYLVFAQNLPRLLAGRAAAVVLALAAAALAAWVLRRRRKGALL